MNEIIGKTLFLIGSLLILHFLYSLLFLLSKRAGKGLYNWLTMDNCLLELLSFPLFTPVYFVATKIYDRFNWLIARLFILLYAILLFSLAIACFVLGAP
ncbi:hypothetical protein [Metabacillus sp. FJAT-52054]|uniref:Uncharacterized protein n=1 Tax=Metabacillus sediminis TaxID=3117746 RepID=A0ABZ2NFY1_9BACI